MTPEQKKVVEFMAMVGQVVRERPDLHGYTRETALRIDLIQEELNELQDAAMDRDVVGVADALGDLLYVVYGAACTFGIDLEPVFDEIHRSNMTKSGGHRRADGKWIKPADYSPPDLVRVLNAQKGEKR